MSREWAETDGSEYPYEFWQQAVKRAIEGKRGQAALRELETALLTMADKRLCEGHLYKDGEVCALGQLYRYRRGSLRGSIDLYRMLNEDYLYCDGDLAEMGEFGHQELGLTFALASRIAEVNDDYAWLSETPEARYERVLRWVRKQLEAVSA